MKKHEIEKIRTEFNRNDVQGRLNELVHIGFLKMTIFSSIISHTLYSQTVLCVGTIFFVSMI